MPSTVIPERGLSRLRKALSKLSLKADERKHVKSPQKSTPNTNSGPWSVPVPMGISKNRARDYIDSTSIGLNGRLFLPQYSEIVPRRLFISDRYTGTEAVVLSRLRITHVVYIATHFTQIYRPLADIQYHHMVVPDDANRLLALIDDAVDFIDIALREDGARVLIHCNTGIDWSPSVAIAWLMRNENCTFEVGKEMVKRKREIVNPSREVEKGVREWWALEVARPLFPPGRGGRSRGHKASTPHITIAVNVLDDESLGEVIDIR